MRVQELWTRRDDLRTTQLHERELDVPDALDDGQALLRVDKFALTANNVSYAVSGDLIGYWRFFPPGGTANLDTDDTRGWGVIPVWGFADVVESKCPDLPVGERLWGFLPMASHLVIRPGRVGKRSVTDAAPHRADLPALYNQYARASADPPELQRLEDERCLFFPLFVTSYVLYDYLIDNDLFQAEQVILGSASSKTAFGLAHLLHGVDSCSVDSCSAEVTGLTSPHHVAFVESLGIYDRVVTYDEVSRLDADVPSVFVDMAGSASVTGGVHRHFGDRIRESVAVGATHWEAERVAAEELPGPPPKFFFAPSQIEKRDREWGPGRLIGKAYEASARIAAASLERIDVQHRSGADAVRSSLHAMLENDVPPSTGLMLSMHDSGSAGGENA